MNVRHVLISFSLGVCITILLLLVPTTGRKLSEHRESTSTPYTTIVMLPSQLAGVDIHYDRPVAVGDLMFLPGICSKRMEVTRVQHQVLALGLDNESHQRLIYVEEVCEP